MFKDILNEWFSRKMVHVVKLVVKKHNNFINLQKNCIVNNFRDIWQSVFRTPNSEGVVFNINDCR